jgi:hypothetical protein
VSLVVFRPGLINVCSEQGIQPFPDSARVRSINVFNPGTLPISPQLVGASFAIGEVIDHDLAGRLFVRSHFVFIFKLPIAEVTVLLEQIQLQIIWVRK